MINGSPAPEASAMAHDHDLAMTWTSRNPRDPTWVKPGFRATDNGQSMASTWPLMAGGLAGWPVKLVPQNTNNKFRATADQH